MHWLTPASLCVAVALAAAAMWSDWRRRRIPHWTVAGLAAIWLPTAVFAPVALGGTVLAGVLCGAAALGAGFALHAGGIVGGGDGKFAAALALWLGVGDLAITLLASGVLLLAFLVVAVVRRRGELRKRGLPVACALGPPATALLLARAVGLAG